MKRNNRRSALCIAALAFALAAIALALHPTTTVTAAKKRDAAKSEKLRAKQATVTSAGDAPVWRDVEASSVPLLNKGKTELISSQREGTGVRRTLALDRDALVEVLRRAPMERTEAARVSPVTLALPMPHGGMSNFNIAESPVMEASLAAAHPEIKTFTAQGVDDPTLSARFSLTPHGFNAIVLGGRDTVFIRPEADSADDSVYISYNAGEFQESGLRPHCDVQSFVSQAELDKFGAMSLHTSAPLALSSGDTLRTYRVALAATGEWTKQYGGGTVNGALAAITTLHNLVNAVYEREVAVRMVIIADEPKIILTDSTGVYTNGDSGKMLDENIKALNDKIGPAGYDIGHVLGTGSGGVAYLRGTCDTAQKGGGVTLQNGPLGNNFDTSTLAHEYGHQFGANHIFNTSVGDCAKSRETAAAFEPGNGNTLMSYTGSCDTSDEVATPPGTALFQFHPFNYQEIMTFLADAAGGDRCSMKSGTGNRAPTVNATATFTIPARTPFRLIATGSDPDGDAITYEWAEFDLAQAASPPNTDADGKERPLFRSVAPSSDPSRTFPQLPNVLAGNFTQNGEILPAITRNMNFRVTVRDNRAGGGGVNSANTQVNVTNTQAAFTVTAPAQGANWTGGSQQTVTWNVAGTSAAPISAANVRITLSTNGGETYPTVLAASVPNTGTATITVPNITTTLARVQVEAVGNIFFNVSPSNFNITASQNPVPTITGLNPTGGPVGTRVEIAGTNLTGVTEVRFNGTLATFQTITDSTEQVIATVPAGATTGPVTVKTASGTATSPANFTVNAAPAVQLSASTYSAKEGDGRVTVTVNRTGDTTGQATVNYATSDTAGLQPCNQFNGVASQRCDYVVSVGTLNFAAGESTKTITIPIVDDSYAEGNETFSITLSNATGATLSTPSAATITITDNDTATGGNPIVNASFFVRQQYIDFLGREPDQPGLQGWLNILNNCPQSGKDAQGNFCDRIEVSAGFFRAPEFQDRGYFVFRFYPVALGRNPNYNEFTPDLAKVSGFLTDAQLEANKVAFVQELMSRTEFRNKYDSLTHPAFVDALLQLAGLPNHPSKDGWKAGLANGSLTRAQVLRQLVESKEAYDKFFNQAFVVMQYFGYLRRDPDALYTNWIDTMNKSGGDYRTMINGFINAQEYFLRFGP